MFGCPCLSPGYGLVYVCFWCIPGSQGPSPALVKKKASVPVSVKWREFLPLKSNLLCLLFQTYLSTYISFLSLSLFLRISFFLLVYIHRLSCHISLVLDSLCMVQYNEMKKCVSLRTKSSCEYW